MEENNFFLSEVLVFKTLWISKFHKFPDRKLRGSPVVGQLIVPKWTFPCCLQPEGTRGVVNDLNNVFECKKLVFGHKTQKFIILIWYWVYLEGIGMVFGGIGCIGMVLGWYWVVLGKIQYLPSTITTSWIFGSYDPIPISYIPGTARVILVVN